jgi:hypothetical protein
MNKKIIAWLLKAPLILVIFIMFISILYISIPASIVIGVIIILYVWGDILNKKKKENDQN